MLHLREQYDAPLPLIFMNSFRTSTDTMAALARYQDLPVDGLPLEFLQNKEPKLLVDDLAPVSYPKDPDLEWCPPGHGDLYTALRGTGLLDRLIDAGYERVFVSNSDNLGAVPDARRRRLVRRRPVRRSRSRPCGVRRRTARAATSPGARPTAGSCCARRAQTLDEDKEALADLDRHRFSSTNNLWFDLRGDEARRSTARGGILGLPLIRNVKNVDPADPTVPR